MQGPPINYTSGTTSTPKGVQLQHVGLIGISLRHGQSSLPLIVARLPATFQLTERHRTIASSIAVTGMLAAANRGGPIDLLAMGVALLG